MFRRAALACVGVCFAARTGIAQTRVSIQATRTSDAIHVDGRLDEPAWASAPILRHFRQLDPDEGMPATERMEVRVLLGSDALYVGARMYDTQIATLQHRRTRRDDETATDAFAIELDPLHDRLHGVRFQVSPDGILYDATVLATGSRDASWDPVWDARTTIDSLGWTAELKLPLSQLRFNQQGDVWGIQLERLLLRRLERSYVALVPKREMSNGTMSPAYYGDLTGLSGLPSPHTVELLPYVSTSASYLHDADAGSLRNANGEYAWRIGADIRAALTSDFSLNATINPDFGQVEVDPAVVNLTTTETRFPEKRPFFVESADRFAYGGLRSYYNASAPTVFYSRRIGRAPHLSAFGDTSVAFARAPAQADILGATKLIGRTSSGWTTGVLEAVTGAESARTLTSRTVPGQFEVEPLTNYLVGRVSRDLRQGETTLGALFTSVNRRLDTPQLGDALASSAYVGGLELAHSWANRSWGIDANLSRSEIAGSTAAISRVQRSPARYLQRPDAQHDRFDGARTSSSGTDAAFSFTKLTGNWIGSVALQDVSPGYETNDAGLLSDASRRALALDLHYQSFEPGNVFRHFIVWPFTMQQWNYDGQLVLNKYNLYLFGELLNRWQIGIEYNYSAAAMDDRLARGGPLARSAPVHTWYYRFDSPSRGRVTYFSESSLNWGEDDRRTLNVGSGMVVQARPSVQLIMNPTFGIAKNPTQYVATYADPTATGTFGTRTLFARLNQRTLGLEARMNWVVAPRLTLQTYVQGLIAASPFDEYKSLSQAGVRRYGIYGAGLGTISAQPSGVVTVDADGSGPAPSFTTAAPDFTVRSLRTNVVMRWEFRPGSTLFAVLQHQSGGTTSFGDQRLGPDLTGLLSGPSDNVFALKASYWLPW